MNVETKNGISNDILLFGGDLFGAISSRDVAPLIKLDAHNKLLKLLGRTADRKWDFLFVNRLIQLSLCLGYSDGYVEGIREYEEINKTVQGLIESSDDRDFEIIAKDVLEENMRRRLLNIQGRQNYICQ